MHDEQIETLLKLSFANKDKVQELYVYASMDVI